MALRPLLLASLVGIAALGALHVPTAQARGTFSISVGTPSPYYRGGYDRGGYDRGGYDRGGYDRGYASDYHRAYDRRYDRRGDRHHYPDHHRVQQAWVPGHWHHSQRGRVWVPGQYERVRGYADDRRDGYGAQVIYRSAPGRVVPRSYYPPGYLSPYDNRRPRGW